MACRISELVLGCRDAELERLLKLGARPAGIGQTGEEQWHVLADPEGNEFCLLKARLKEL
ncbi:VOC family protein [Streptomyces iakyrus]